MQVMMASQNWVQKKIDDAIANLGLHNEDNPVGEYKYDVFISHASSDKLPFVNDLYVGLMGLGLNVWYDKTSIEWGDDWEEKIQEGLKKCRFGIVVLSHNFFNREWTENELYSLLERQNVINEKLILPILFGVEISDVRRRYPKLGKLQMLPYEWNVSKTEAVQEIVIAFAKVMISSLRKSTNAAPKLVVGREGNDVKDAAIRVERKARESLRAFKMDVGERNTGMAAFDYRGNAGSFVISGCGTVFNTMWSECGTDSIYAYRDSVKLIGFAEGINDFPQSATTFESFDWTRRVTTLRVGEMVVFVNADHRFLAVKVLSVLNKSRGAEKNELQIAFRIY